MLHSVVLDIRRVTADSVKENYPWVIDPSASLSPDDVVRVDWQTWAVPNNFNGTYEEAVVERAESIVVDIPTLLAREVFSYGLGPEYNWLSWQEFAAPGGELRTEVFRALCDVIRGDWADRIREYADGDVDYQAYIHPALSAAVAEVISQRGED